MARITVEDCLPLVDNRFALCIHIRQLVCSYIHRNGFSTLILLGEHRGHSRLLRSLRLKASIFTIKIYDRRFNNVGRLP